MSSKLIINVGKVCLCRAMHGEKVDVAEVAKKYNVEEEQLQGIMSRFRETKWFHKVHQNHAGHNGCPLELKI